MAQIVIEIVSPGLRREFRKFDIPDVRVGRGLQNDLILSDPFVSAEHILIRQEDNGSWTVEDLGSENGIFLKKYSQVVQVARIQSGDEIKIGKTRLRIFAAHHKVGPTRLLATKDAFLKRLNRPWSVWVAIAGVFVLYAMESHLASVENLTLRKLSASSIVILLSIVIWASIWAFVGRLIRHKASFPLQMTITCFYFILLIPFNETVGIIGYLTSSSFVMLWTTEVLMGILFVLLLMAHLAVATNLSFKARIISSTLLTFIMLSTGSFIYMAYKDDFWPDPKLHGVIKPPLVKIVPSQPINLFLKDSNKIFDVHHRKKK